MTPFRLLSAVSVCLVALAGSAAVARAQHASGILIEDDEHTPARAVLVRATEVRSGKLIGSTRSLDDGTFRLRIGRDSVRLEALRIGVRPVQLAEVRAREDVTGLRFVLRAEPIRLPARGTVTRTRCDQTDRDAARLASTLFGQVVIALSNAVLSDSSLVSEARTRYIARTADEISTLVDRYADSSGAGVRGPVTRPVDALYRQGFLSTDFENRNQFAAPSVEFFLAERFLEDYCLFLAGDAAGGPDEVGVGFHSARRRGVAQLSGTFWLKRESLRLDRLTFGYDGIPREETSGKPEGYLEFAPLPDGRLITSRWQVRMPQIGVRSVSRRNPPSLTVERFLTGVSIHSGEVRLLASGTVLLFASGAGPVMSEVPRRVAQCTTNADRHEVEGRVTGAGGALAGWTLEWTEAVSVPVDSASQGTAVAIAADGTFRLCELPGGIPLRFRVRDASGMVQHVLTYRASAERGLSVLQISLPAR